MLKLTLPKRERIFGPEKSKVFEIIGGKAFIADVAIATGGKFDDNSHVEGDNLLKERAGWYWTGDKVDNDNMLAVTAEGTKFYPRPVISRGFSVRPALQFSSIDDLTSLVSEDLEDVEEGIKKGKVYVPLYVEKENTIQLQELLNDGKIKPIDPNKVSFPTFLGTFESEPFRQKNNFYYAYEGDLYLLLEFTNARISAKLNDGRRYGNGDSILLKVEETDLYVDEEKKEAYFDLLLFAGVPITKMEQYFDVYLKELLALQKVVREINGKSQSNLKTSPKDYDNAMEAQKPAQYFSKLCAKSASLDVKIQELMKQLKQIEAEKKDIDEKIGQCRRLMSQEGTGYEK